MREGYPFGPTNHYGVSKASADLLGCSYALQGLRVINVRPFNHSGSGQSLDFLLPTLVERFAQIKAGSREPIIKLGNLDSVRDLSDVRDVVQAYRLTLKRKHFVSLRLANEARHPASFFVSPA